MRSRRRVLPWGNDILLSVNSQIFDHIVQSAFYSRFSHHFSHRINDLFIAEFVCYDDVYNSEVVGCGADGLLPAPQDCEREQVLWGAGRLPVATIPEPGVLWGRRREQRVFPSVHDFGGK